MGILRYAKNVGASFKYTAIGMAAEIVPSLSALISQVSTSEARTGLKDSFAETNSILRENVGDLLKKGLDSTVKAVRTGELAREDTLDEVATQFGEMFGLDSDLFDNSFLTAGVEGGGSAAGNTAASAAFGAASGVAAVAKSLRDSPSMKTMAEAGVASAKYGRAQVAQTIASGNAIRTAVLVNGRYLNQIAHFQATVQHRYYNKSLELMSTQRMLLAEISNKLNSVIQGVALTAAAGDQAMQAFTGKTTDFARAFGSAGGFNVSEYIGIMNRRLKTAIGEGSMFQMTGKMYANSPMRSMMEMIGSELVPLRKQFAQFSDFLGRLGGVLGERMKHAAGNLRARVGGGTRGALGRGLGGLLDFFSVTPERVSGPDLGRYVKGKAVAFDGFAHRAIVEVIPSLLSRIHAELEAHRAHAGAPPPGDFLAYDYNTGRFGSAKAAQASVVAQANSLSMAHMQRVRTTVGMAGAGHDEMFQALRDSGLSIRRGGPDDLFKQLHAHANSLPASRAKEASAIKAGAGQLASAMKRSPKDAARISYNLQSSILRARSEHDEQIGRVGSPGSEGGARWAYAAEAYRKSDSELRKDAESRRRALLAISGGPSAIERLRGAAAPGEGFEHGHSGARMFRNADGKVTARDIIRSPVVAVSKAMDAFERGVSDLLFGKGAERLGGFFGSLKDGLVGPEGPDGKRGGIFGGVYAYLLGRGRAAKSFLLNDGSDGKQKGILIRAKEGLLGLVSETKDYLFGKVGPGGARGGGVLGHLFGSAKDRLFGAGSRDKPLRELIADRFKTTMDAMGAWVTKRMEPLTKKLEQAGAWLEKQVLQPLSKWFSDPKTGLVARIEGTIKSFFYGDQASGREGFLKRVVEPARDFIKKEIWEPLKVSVKSMWDEAGKFLKAEVVEPLRGIMKPFVEEAKEQYRLLKEWVKGPLKESFLGAARVVGREIDNTFKDAFGKGLGDMLRTNVLNPIKDALSSVRQFLGDALKTLLKIPVNILRGASDELKVSQLKRGMGSHISAEERARLITERGLDPSSIPHSGGSSFGGPTIVSGPGTKVGFWQRTRGRVRAAVATGADAAHNILHETTGVPHTTLGTGNEAAAHETAADQGARQAPGGQGRGIRGALRAGAMTVPDMTAIIRDAARATADNTRNLYRFATRHLWGVGKNLERIVAHFRIQDVSLGKNDASKRSGILGKMRDFVMDPIGSLSRLVGGIFDTINGVLKRAADSVVSVVLLPFKAVGKVISGINSSFRWIRGEMGEIFGFAWDATTGIIKGAAKGVFWGLRESLKVAGGAFREFGGLLLGTRGKDGKRSGGLIGSLAHAGYELGKGILKVSHGLIKVMGTIANASLKFAGTLLGIGAHLIKEGVVGGAQVAGHLIRAVMPGLSASMRRSKLIPVFVVGGRLADVHGGAGSWTEALVTSGSGVFRVVRGAVGAALGGLVGGLPGAVAGGALGSGAAGAAWNAAKGHYEKARGAIEGGFGALREKASKAGMAKSMAEWHARTLAANEGAAGHLAEIHKGIHSFGSMLMMAVPIILSAIVGIWRFFSGGSFVKSMLGMGSSLLSDKRGFLGGGGGGGLGGLGETAADVTGPSTAPKKVGRSSRLGRLGGSRLGQVAAGAAGLFGKIGSAGGALLRGGGALLRGATSGVGLAGAGISMAADNFMDDGIAKAAVKTGGSMLQYGAMGAALGSVVPGLGNIAGAAIGAGVGAVIENWGTIQKGVKAVAGAAGKGLGLIGKGASAIGSGISAANGAINKGVSAVTGAIGSGIGAVGSAIGRGVKAVGSAASSSYEAAKGIGASLLSGAGSAISGAFSGGRTTGGKGNATAASIPSGGLGALSSRFESGAGGAGAVGRDSTGGPSYGTYQIATKTGTFGKFMSWLGSHDPEAAKQLVAAGGEAAAAREDPAFVSTFKSLASKPEFAEAQHDFIKSSHFDPLVASLQRDGLDVSKRSKGLQDVIWSTAVQHGGSTDVVRVALRKLGKDPSQVTDSELASAIYAERRGRFGGSSQAVRDSVLRRFQTEEKMAQGMIGQAPGPANAGQAAPGGAGATAPGSSVSPGGASSSSSTGATVGAAGAGPGATASVSMAGPRAAPAAAPLGMDGTDGTLSGGSKGIAGGTSNLQEVLSAAGSGPVGTGQCVALVQKVAGVGHTSGWTAGAPVLGNNIAPGTPIASFDADGKYGNHTDHTSHAAIYVGPSTTKPGGIRVYDQWKGQGPHYRDLGTTGAPANNATKFSVIKVNGAAAAPVGGGGALSGGDSSGGATSGGGATDGSDPAMSTAVTPSSGAGPDSVAGTAASQAAARIGTDGVPATVGTAQPGDGGGLIASLLTQILSAVQATADNTSRIAGGGGAAGPPGAAGAGASSTVVANSSSIFQMTRSGSDRVAGPSPEMARLVAGS